MTLDKLEVVRRFQLGLNANDFSVVDRYVSAFYVSHDPGIPSDKNQWKDLLAQAAQAYLENYSSIDDIYEDGDRIYVKRTEEYKQVAPLFGHPPNYKLCRMACVDAYCVEGGLITEIFPTTVVGYEELA